MMITEIDSLIDNFQIDDCQAWPQIMEIDAAKMYLIDQMVKLLIHQWK